ncbi:MAG: arabinose-5-phosphate isomerase [Candidatus Azotimanducaceae bacterium]|jgi:arabinose-5-phosphate isomerase
MNVKERMRDVIAKEAAAIAAINVTDTFEEAAHIMMNCRGKIITTGIGKAGYIAHKFAATLSSTGTPAFFVHPAEAGHGDLGMLGTGDCIIAFSTSGKSNEVLEMLGIASNLGVEHVIAITSHIDSPIRELSEVVLDMGSDIEEPCPLNITPSATTAVMLAISDALALTLMEMKGFTAADYHARHHRGYLGSLTRPKNTYDNDPK